MRLPVRAVPEFDGVPPLVIVDADGVTIADCMVVGTPDEECEANARSIVEAINAAGGAWIRHAENLGGAYRVGGSVPKPTPHEEVPVADAKGAPGPSTRSYHPGGAL